MSSVSSVPSVSDPAATAASQRAGTIVDLLAGYSQIAGGGAPLQNAFIDLSVRQVARNVNFTECHDQTNTKQLAEASRTFQQQTDTFTAAGPYPVHRILQAGKVDEADGKSLVAEGDREQYRNVSANIARVWAKNNKPALQERDMHGKTPMDLVLADWNLDGLDALLSQMDAKERQAKVQELGKARTIRQVGSAWVDFTDKEKIRLADILLKYGADLSDIKFGPSHLDMISQALLSEGTELLEWCLAKGPHQNYIDAIRTAILNGRLQHLDTVFNSIPKAGGLRADVVRKVMFNLSFPETLPPQPKKEGGVYAAETDLKSQADVKAMDSHSPLDPFSQYVVRVLTLLESHGVDIKFANTGTESLFYSPLVLKNTALLKWCVDKFEKQRYPIAAKMTSKAEVGNPEALDYLLGKLSPEERASTVQGCLESLKEQDKLSDIVKVLVKHGGDINKAHIGGISLPCYVAQNPQAAEALTSCLELGLDVQNSTIALSQAIECRNTRIALKLLETNAELMKCINSLNTIRPQRGGYRLSPETATFANEFLKGVMAKRPKERVQVMFDLMESGALEDLANGYTLIPELIALCPDITAETVGGSQQKPLTEYVTDKTHNGGMTAALKQNSARASQASWQAALSNMDLSQDLFE